MTATLNMSEDLQRERDKAEKEYTDRKVYLRDVLAEYVTREVVSREQLWDARLRYQEELRLATETREKVLRDVKERAENEERERKREPVDVVKEPIEFGELRVSRETDRPPFQRPFGG